MVNPTHDEAPTSTRQLLNKLWGLTLLLGDQIASGLDERRLTVARAGLIWELLQRGPVTQRVLSQALRVTPRNITGLVDALEADALAERTPHPDDRRATLVRLTDSGVALAARLQGEQDEFADYLFADMSPEERVAAVALLERIRERVEALRDGAPVAGLEGRPGPRSR